MGRFRWGRCTGWSRIDCGSMPSRYTSLASSRTHRLSLPMRGSTGQRTSRGDVSDFGGRRAPGSAEDIGLSLVVLMLMFACAALIRGRSRPLRALFIPTAVIGGFLILALGPEGLGRLTGGTGIFPAKTFAVW